MGYPSSNDELVMRAAAKPFLFRDGTDADDVDFEDFLLTFRKSFFALFDDCFQSIEIVLIQPDHVLLLR